MRIGGTGRSVTGQVVLDGTPEAPIEWTHNRPAMITRTKREGEKTPPAFVSLGSNFDKDGRFRIDDVTPGTYELSISVNAKPNPQDFEPGEALGSVRMSVTVPDSPRGQSDEPFDLGTITAALFDRLKVGDLAPDFAVPRIAGKGKGDQLRLADYRGKLVLVDFWATWSGPSLAEMPGLKQIQKTFGALPQFALISLACDQKDEPAKEYVRENGLIWTHGFAGDLVDGRWLSLQGPRRSRRRSCRPRRPDPGEEPARQRARGGDSQGPVPAGGEPKMSLFLTWLDVSLGLRDVSIGLVLIVKLTIVLALAWLAHGMLCGQKPSMARCALALDGRRAGSDARPLSVPTYRDVSTCHWGTEVGRDASDRLAFGNSRDRPRFPPPERFDLRRHSSRFASGSTRSAQQPSLAPSVVTDSESAPAPAKSQEFRWDARIDPWLWSIWLAGVLVLTVRLIVGSLGLARLVRRSSAVPEAIVRECLDNRRPPGMSSGGPRAADVGGRDSLPGRALCIPSCSCRSGNAKTLRSDDLRAILAHELAHARNHDLAWNLAAHVASILLWFHPLAWRIRAAHAAACDAVCDAVAVDLLGDVASYGRTPGTAGRAGGWPSPVHGLAMARTFRRPPPHRCPEPEVFRCAALRGGMSCRHSLIASAVVVLIGGFAVSRGPSRLSSASGGTGKGLPESLADR